MTAPAKHVLLLTVDSLKPSHLESYGAPVGFTPTIDRFVREGLSCERVYAHACPTQPSFPTIHSSTLPLDHGGYDWGVRHRPITIAEAFANAGYLTSAFVTSPWLDAHFGYRRGYAEFYPHYDFALLWSNISKLYIRYAHALHDEGRLSEEEYVARVTTILADTLPFMRDFVASHYETDALYRCDPEELLDRLEAECREFESDPEDYVRTNQERLLIADLLAFLRIGSSPRSRKLRSYATELGVELDAWLVAHADVPTFTWVHYGDLHSVKDLKPAVMLEQGRERYPELIEAVEELGDSYRHSLAYDIALRTVDDSIAQTLDTLDSKGMLEETLVVVTGDHGAKATLDDHDAHIAETFYEEFLRVPLVFWQPGAEPRAVAGTWGLVDLAPTTIELAGLDPVPSFTGRSAASDDPRSHLLMESAGRGACDLEHNPVQLCVTDGEVKLTYRKGLVADVRRTTYAPGANELYQLASDPGELVNRWDDPALAEVQATLVAVAEARCSELREGYRLAPPEEV